MKSPAPEILLLGVKRTIVAFERETGRRVWHRELASGMGSEFVTLIADTRRVYAHTHGHIYCLDLSTGVVLWEDELRGLSYGIASIVLPGIASTSVVSPAAQVIQNLEASSGSTLS